MFSIKSKSSNILEQKLKNAAATGVLSLRESGLKAFPAQVLEIDKLHTLDLHANAIKEVPHSIARLVKMKSLQLQSNKIRSMPPLTSMTKLHTLALDHNELSSLDALPDAKLKKLTLSCNHFIQFPPVVFALAKTLQVLDLSGNQIELLPPQISECASIEELHLDDNRLIMLPEEIGMLGKLRALYLRRNQLQTLPVELLRDSSVDKMQLEGNLFNKKQFMSFDGYEDFAARRTALKQKGMEVASEISGMDLCGLPD